MYTKETVLQSYQRLGNIKAVVNETGVPPYTAFIWLKKANVLKANEGSRYGTIASRNGYSAELEFHKLVPIALSANNNLQNNCPTFDFDVNGNLIDVKYSSLNKSGRWKFDTAKNKQFQPDFYVAFFATSEDGDLQKGYHLFLIPNELFKHRSVISLNPKRENDELWSFKIEPSELSKILNEKY